jgi:hypothetical protein
MFVATKTPASGMVAATLLLISLALPPASAVADVVTDWNETADATVTLFAGPPPFQARIMAMVHVATHDALNSIVPRFASYTALPVASPGASPDAAVATAAFTVLADLLPARADALELLYNNRIAELTPCPDGYPSCVEDGVAAGRSAALEILALRAHDGASTPHQPYDLLPSPGVYQPTPPNFSPPTFAGWGSVTPFSLTHASQFRADPPELFDLTGEAYTRDFIEVKRVGSVDAEANGHRTADQSAIARYWPGGGVNFNAVARVIVAGRGLDPWEHARLFAILNVATSDAAVTVFETKYVYNFWRPVTAIRAADTDGNPATEPDPQWLPLLATPPYPDYTCGLTSASGAGAAALHWYFQTDAIPYTFTAAGITRSYTSLSQAAAESVDARVYAGIHFRTSCEQAVRQGAKVARYVVSHHFKPLKGRARR